MAETTGTPPTTILTYSFRLVYINTSGYTRTPVVSTTHLSLLKNFTNNINVCPCRASLPSVNGEVWLSY